MSARLWMTFNYISGYIIFHVSASIHSIVRVVLLFFISFWMRTLGITHQSLAHNLYEKYSSLRICDMETGKWIFSSYAGGMPVIWHYCRLVCWAIIWFRHNWFRYGTTDTNIFAQFLLTKTVITLDHWTLCYITFAARMWHGNCS